MRAQVLRFFDKTVKCLPCLHGFPKSRMRILSEGLKGRTFGYDDGLIFWGGYVFNTIHNITPGVPAVNVDALARAVRDHNRG